jgi:16S rRNA processing protein RimM
MRELRLKTKAGAEVLVALDDIRVTQKAVIAGARSDSDEEIASFRGASVVVSRSERHQLPEDEYYADDLVGLTVKDTNGGVIGKLCEVWETPANDVYQVLDDGGREILLPAIEDVILEVDIEGGTMVADVSNLI